MTTTIGIPCWPFVLLLIGPSSFVILVVILHGRFIKTWGINGDGVFGEVYGGTRLTRKKVDLSF